MSSSGGSTKQQSQEALLSELDSIMALLDAPVPAAPPQPQPAHDAIPVLDAATVPTLEAEIPVLEAAIPVLDAEVPTLDDDIPVLGEVADSAPRASVPGSGPGNGLGSELDTIVELLIERRLPQIRQQLHDELLAELQEKLGL